MKPPSDNKSSWFTSGVWMISCANAKYSAWVKKALQNALIQNPTCFELPILESVSGDRLSFFRRLYGPQNLTLRFGDDTYHLGESQHFFSDEEFISNLAKTFSLAISQTGDTFHPQNPCNPLRRYGPCVTQVNQVNRPFIWHHIHLRWRAKR